MTETVPAFPMALASGRRVTLLPRSGGQSWAGTVARWDAVDGTVVAQIQAAADAVSSLDHHQVWVSTVSRDGDERGVTIFAGRAREVGRDLLQVDDMVRLTDEPRRRAVRATGCVVTLPPAGGPQCQVDALDISRGAVRLPMVAGGWTYDDPLDLVVHLEGDTEIVVVGRLLRVDTETSSVVLDLDDLTETDSEAIDRFVLAQLPD